MRDVLGMNIPQAWEQIGKSNMRELVPVLKRIITGEEARGTVENAVQILVQDAEATFAAAGEDPTDDEVNRAVVEQLLEHGMNLTNRRLRQHIRPERTPIIEATTVTVNDDVIVLAMMNPDQWQMFMRKLGNSVDPLPFVAPRDPAQRTREAMQIPALRAVVDIVNPPTEDVNDV